MTSQFTGYVIDASVGIKLFITEPLADKTAELFAEIANCVGTQITVPELFYLECASILWKHVRWFEYPDAKANRDLADLKALALRNVPIANLFVAAYQIARQHEITVYDACYITLADQLDQAFVTTDNKLVTKFYGTQFRVIHLNQYIPQ